MTKAVVLRSKPKVSDVRHQWVTALGVLTSGNMTRAEAEMKLRAYVPLLQDEFPPAAFCQDSLSAVARQCQWFPSYAEVARHLSEWWRAHRPAPVALPPPPAPEPRPPPTPEEVAHVRELVAEVTSALRAAALYRDSRAFDLDPPRPQPRYLTPEQLDSINPLPNGRKRVPQQFTEATDRPDLSPGGDDQATAAG
jgi:hypothetical protein